MGSYRQHVSFAWLLGTAYAVAAFVLAGIPWLYGTVAVLLAMLGGMLPDIDSETGVELKGFTGILAVLVAVSVWHKVGRLRPELGFEVHLWMTVLAYVLVRHGMRRIVARITVHRGILHSLPMLGICAEITYLTYPSEYHIVRLMMAAAVGLGFFSHLLLDELCSVDLRGARVNKAFGTAMKFWSSSALATIGVYGVLTYFTWKVVNVWPDEPFSLSARVPTPSLRGVFPLEDFQGLP